MTRFASTILIAASVAVGWSWNWDVEAGELLAAPYAVPEAMAEHPAFSFTAYVWAAGLNGRSSTLPPLPPADVDIGFIDALKDLDGGLLGKGEINYGRWSFATDIMFSQASPGGSLPSGSGVGVRSRSLTIQQDILYRVYEEAGTFFDAGAGLRYWYLDNRLNVDPTTLIPAGIDFGVSKDWLDPVIAARFSFPIDGAWSATLAGDIGGFGVGSDFTYQVLGTVNYRWSEKMELRFGYRLLSVDYQDGDFLYDMRQHGPLLALSYSF